MASDSTSVSQSTSTSGLPGLAQMAEGLMQEQYSWGQQQFAQNSQLTDQVVGDLMNLYGSMSGIGNTLMNMYQNAFVPEYQNLVQDANNYSSQARIQQAMGAAESGVAQNFNGQRDAALADLQSFGIDPSSGRYAQLDAAERMQEAAAAAGAGFQAEQATEATGRGLRSEALQLGSVMPSQATAAYNAASGAATAGENAKLANTQEGVNAMGSPVQWGGLASALKNSQSSSASRTQGSQPQSKSQSTPNKQSNNDGQSYNPSPVDPSAIMGPNTAAMGDGGGGNAGGNPGDKIYGQGGTPNSNLPGGGPPTQPPITEPPEPPFGEGATPPPDYEDPGLGAATDPGQAMFTDETPWDPGSQQMDNSQGVLPTDSALSNNNTVNPGTSNANPWPTSTDDTTFSAGPTLNTDQDTGGDTVNFNGGTSGNDNNSVGAGGDTSGNDEINPDDNPTPPVPTSNDNTDSGGGDDSFSGGDDSMGMARGGEVRAHAGAIPYHMSPSHGRVTDDVRAKLNDTGEDLRLNAGEFVMPRHAVNWYGEKHFQDLIRKSKEARAKSGAKPSMKPALPSRGAIPTRNDDHGYHG